MPKSKDKGKRRATEQEVTQQLAETAVATPSTGFHLLACEIELPLPPAADLRKTAREVLEQWVSRYIPSLGVVLCSISWPLQFPDPSAHFLGNGSAVLLKVRFEGVGWRPVVGSRLIGKINTSSSAHVGLLLHNTFNATIEHFSIPKKRYTYDAEKIAPFVKERERLKDQTEQETEYNDYDAGCWVDKKTGEPLGGEEGKLQFTVIGLTIASGIVTTLGSLLNDPLNPPRRQSNFSMKATSEAVDQDAAAEAFRAPTSKTVRFEADMTSPPPRKIQKRKHPRSDDAVDTSVDTVVDVTGEEDESDRLESVEGVEEVEPTPKRKKRRKQDATQ